MNKLSKRTLVLAAISLAACGRGNSRPAAADPAAAADRAAIAEVDREFVREAASASMLEIASSQLALQRGELDPRLEGFAEQMLRDHSAASERLSALARALGMEPPQELLPGDQAMLSQLERAPPESIFEVYYQTTLSTHQESIERFEICARECRDSELRAFAEEILPALRAHMQVLRDLQPVSVTGGD